MEAYSRELCRDVLSACYAGGGTWAIALRFGCLNRAASCLSGATGARQDRPLTERRRRKAWEPHVTWLLAKLDERANFNCVGGSSPAKTGLGTFRRDAQSRLSDLAAHAKKQTCVPLEQQREDIVEARRQWAAVQLEFDFDRVVFIDETLAKTNMTRSYGRSEHGARLVQGVP